MQLELGEGAEAIAAALEWLEASAHPEVDNLADWLLVSAMRVGGEAPQEVLSAAVAGGITVRVARAAGEKCERCWHYETDVAEHALAEGVGGRICGRCRTVLRR